MTTPLPPLKGDLYARVFMEGCEASPSDLIADIDHFAQVYAIYHLDGSPATDEDGQIMDDVVEQLNRGKWEEHRAP